MPLYEYKCTAKEEHTFERRAGYEDAVVKCHIVLNPHDANPGNGPDYCEAPAYRQIPTADSNIGIIIR